MLIQGGGGPEGAGLGEGQAEAGRDPDQSPVRRRSDGRPGWARNPLRPARSPGRGAADRQGHDELLAAVPSHEVFRPRRLAERVGHLAEHQGRPAPWPKVSLNPA